MEKKKNFVKSDGVSKTDETFISIRYRYLGVNIGYVFSKKALLVWLTH